MEEIRRIVENKLAPLGRKVYAIVNYDNFEIFPDVIDEYSTMVRDLVDRFYSGVTRYTTSSFLRAKLGDALKQRAMAPHIYESAEEATTHLRDLEDENGLKCEQAPEHCLWEPHLSGPVGPASAGAI